MIKVVSNQEQTKTGAFPLSFKSKGTPLTDYKLYGTSAGAGVETENLFDGKGTYSLISGNSTVEFQSETLVVSNGYGVYFDIDIAANTNYAINVNPQDSTGYLAFTAVLLPSEIRVVGYQSSLVSTTFNSGSDNKIRMLFYSGSSASSETYSIYSGIMLVKGSTAPSTYIPYGYKLPLTVESEEESTTTPIYIGDSKLGEEEYVGFVEQKVYKLKEVHKDTVTINGIEWDILGYDHDEVYKADGTLAKHSVTIQTHDCIAKLQFGKREALFAFPEGLAAGTYTFTIRAHSWVASDIGKSITFTLAQAIPAGGQLVVSQAYNASFTTGNIASYANGSTTAIETVKMNEGSAGTSLGDVTNAVAENTNSCQRALLGSNNWDESALKQWANSDAPAGSEWQPQTKFDRPPSWATTTAGFLHGLDPEFVKTLGYAKKVTALNNVSDGGGTKETDEKVFLISRTEAYMGNEVAGGEGKPYAYYSEYSDLAAPGTGKDTNRIKYRAGAAKYWWLRSPSVGDASLVRLVSPSGELSHTSAPNPGDVAPACCIILDDIADNSWLREHFLSPADPPVALPELSTYQGENTLSCSEGLGDESQITYVGPVEETITKIMRTEDDGQGNITEHVLYKEGS